jgi:hypothetical protein
VSGQLQASATSSLPHSGTRCLGDWVGPRAELEEVEKLNISAFLGIMGRFPGPSARSLSPKRTETTRLWRRSVHHKHVNTQRLSSMCCIMGWQTVYRFCTCVTVALTSVWREIMWNISEPLNRCAHPWRVLTQAEALHMLMLPSGMNHIQPVKVVFYWLEPGLWVRSIVPARTL